MSLSSFGNFSASGAATLLAPDCSSALGLYVPSVCLFFFTTQKSQARTASTMATTPRVTMGATIAAMLGPCKQKDTGQLVNLVKLDNLWCYLVSRSKTLTHIIVIRSGANRSCGKIPCRKSRISETPVKKVSSSLVQSKQKKNVCIQH